MYNVQVLGEVIISLNDAMIASCCATILEWSGRIHF
jgi:hypothetical protein